MMQRAYTPGRSGDLQLLLTPFNSANYSNESLSPGHRTTRGRATRACGCTSSGSRWSCTRPDASKPSDHTRAGDARGPRADRRGSSWASRDLADGSGGPRPRSPLRAGRRGRRKPPQGHRHVRLRRRRLERAAELPGSVAEPEAAHGGGRELPQRPDTGRCPAVTACAHATIGTGTFPNQHGITGHNIRDGNTVRKAYRYAGLAPTPATSWCRRWPTSGTSRPAARRGWARSATRCGTWACSGTAGGTGPRATCRWASIWTGRPGRRVAAAQPGPLPPAGVGAGPRASSTASGGVHRAPDWDAEFTPHGQRARRAAARPSCTTRAT